MDGVTLFDRLWEVVKSEEAQGELTVERALDAATRLPQALYTSMMECLVENGEDPAIIVVQVGRLHEVTLKRLREIANALQHRLTKIAPLHTTTRH